MSWVNEFLYNAKLIGKDTFLLRESPANIRDEVIQALENRSNVTLYSDVLEASKAANRLDMAINQMVEKAIPSGRSIQQYEPAGSTIRKMFPNPFAPYSYVGDNYWAAFLARRENRIEIIRDGYVLIAPEGASKKRIKLVNDILEDLKIGDFRAQAADYLNVFGNCWVDVVTNKLGGLKSLNFLLPENLIPTVHPITDRVDGWDYWQGKEKVHFSLSDVDHLKTYSLRSLDLGFPGLGPVLVDIEADMFASLYSVTLFKKGGLIRAIVSVQQAENESVINDNTFLDFVAKMQKWFERLYGGIRGAGEIVFTPNVAGVYPLVSPSEIEAPHARTSDKTAIKVCELLGVPPERIGISRTSQYVNNAQVDDSVSLSFDNHNYYLVGIVDDYINKKIIRDILGEEEIQIQMSGEFGSLSKSAAEFGQLLAQVGAKAITVDEFRVRVLHWEPLGAPYGDKFLGEELWKTNQAAAKKAFGTTDIAGYSGLVKHYPKFIRYY